jgi:hypothetical protein
MPRTRQNAHPTEPHTRIPQAAGATGHAANDSGTILYDAPPGKTYPCHIFAGKPDITCRTGAAAGDGSDVK